MRKSRQPRRIAANFFRCAANDREAAARYPESGLSDLAARDRRLDMTGATKLSMASS
jgi:hypothetical protein